MREEHNHARDDEVHARWRGNVAILSSVVDGGCEQGKITRNTGGILGVAPA